MKKNIFFSIIALGLFTASLIAGECVSGNCVNGQGIMTFANGDKYIGEFKTERKSGYGVYLITLMGMVRHTLPMEMSMKVSLRIIFRMEKELCAITTGMCISVNGSKV
jgi:hypothetical protein